MDRLRLRGLGRTMKPSDNILHFPDAEQFEESAGEWAVRVAEGGLSEQEKAAFQSWYAANARHREAFSRLSQLWQHCDALAELTDHAASDITRASRAGGGSREGGALGYLSGRRALLAASLAAIALLVAGTLEDKAIVLQFPVASAAYETSVATALGERRTLTLPDGSLVELNTASQVAVRYSASARVVRLTQGEAHFTVTSDPQRPFSVHVADRLVTAVGTAFTVQLRRDAVEVTVAEGRVSLTEPQVASVGNASAERNGSLPALEAGQSALWRAGSRRIAALGPAELERKLAWRQGMLAFAGEPLSQVLQEIGRYTDIVIEVTDPALRDLPVAGRLRIDDVESMLQALQLMADVRVERLDDRHVRLSGKSKA
jgi:transmembrane sensor